MCPNSRFPKQHIQEPKWQNSLLRRSSLPAIRVVPLPSVSSRHAFFLSLQLAHSSKAIQPHPALARRHHLPRHRRYCKCCQLQPAWRWGVGGATHRTSEPQILKECRKRHTGRHSSGLATGKAVITISGQLPARHVIHTVYSGDCLEGRPPARARIAGQVLPQQFAAGPPSTSWRAGRLPVSAPAFMATPKPRPRLLPYAWCRRFWRSTGIQPKCCLQPSRRAATRSMRKRYNRCRSPDA